MFNFVFSACIFAGAMHCAFVGSAPADSDLSGLRREVEIVGRAGVDLVRVFGEFLQSVAKIVKERVQERLTNSVLTLAFKAHIVVTGCGIELNDKTLNLKRYAATAKSAVKLRERLDLMEGVEEVIDASVAQAADRMLVDRGNSFDDLYVTLDKNFKADATLGVAYESLRQQYEKDEMKNRKKGGDEQPEITSFADLPKEKQDMLVRSMLNKLFLHHIVNRITTLKRDYFILARSMVELAKNAKKFEKVQRVYEETLSEVTSTIVVRQFYGFVETQSLFEKLKENFQKQPSLNQDLQAMQINVAKRNDWDKSVWDMDLILL